MSAAHDHETLVAIIDYIADHDYPPTVRDLGRILNLSPSSVHSRLASLIEAGQIERVGPHKLIIVKEKGSKK